jgi:nucleotide-binding universal stress UspA family protein
MLKRILVPLDGSEFAEQALHPARELAEAFGSEVRLVSVCKGGAEEHVRVLRAYLEQKAAGLKDGMKNAAATVSVEVLEGDPAERIIEEAVQRKTDLIIITSHGHAAIRLWALGGTAQKVVHDAPVSVLLVRTLRWGRKKRAAGAFEQILVPLDGLEPGERALPVALEIAAKLKARVTLLGVVESSQRVHTIGGQDYVHFPEQRVEEMKKELTAYLDRTAGRFAERGVAVRPVIRSGDAAHEITKFSRRSRTRVIIMSGHNRSGLREWVFGSVSAKILHASRKDLLLVKPKRDEEVKK